MKARKAESMFDWKAERQERRRTRAGKCGVFCLPAVNSCLSALNFCLSALLPFCLAGALLSISGCTRAQAKITPDGPLDVPAPPARDVETTEAEPPPLIPLAQEPARNTPTRPRP